MTDLTFCLGFRNWHVDHLRRCLASIRRMTDERVIVVDLGTEHLVTTCDDDGAPTGLKIAPWTDLDAVRVACKDLGAGLVAYPWRCWNRALALNVAIRRSTTSHIVLTDADMVFCRGWRREVGVALDHFPGQFWATRSRDASPGDVSMLLAWDDASLRHWTDAHPDVGQGAACVVPRAWLERVRGLDETYEVWGCEDNDLVVRAQWDGLPAVWLPEQVFVVHQWHRRDWPTDAEFAVVVKNREYLAERLAARGPVGRNPGGWGGLPNDPAESVVTSMTRDFVHVAAGDPLCRAAYPAPRCGCDKYRIDWRL